VLLPVLVAAALLGLAAPAPASALPADWTQVSTGPSGGVVYAGRIPNTYARWDTRPSAVYLPPGYTTARTYPVIYLLHGMRGSPSSLWDSLRLAAVADSLISSGRAAPFIAVMPVAGPTVHPDSGEWAGVWESYVVGDVVPWIDAHLPTRATLRGRALEGLCAGGFGAVDIGLRHPGLFGTLGSWEGYFAPVFRDGPFTHATQAQLAAHTPTLLLRREAPRLAQSSVRFYISVGGNHGRILRRWSVSFARELATRHLAHRLWLLPAPQRGHFWSATLPSALTYAAAGF
jgi:enterochelin esterase-like enzyme